MVSDELGKAMGAPAIPDEIPPDRIAEIRMRAAKNAEPGIENDVVLYFLDTGEELPGKEAAPVLRSSGKTAKSAKRKSSSGQRQRA